MGGIETGGLGELVRLSRDKQTNDESEKSENRAEDFNDEDFDEPGNGGQ